MTDKRFIEIISTQKVIDNLTGKEYDCLIDDELLKLLNELAEENEHLKQELHKIKVVNEMLSMDFSNSEHELWRENEQLKTENKKLRRTERSWRKIHCCNDESDNCGILQSLSEENEQLKKELHLMHMRTMFSTVQSFKGDVSKRYKYSKETDRIYDTANHYGQYDKVLDKKEIVMLLNEYETVLNELKGDLE